jgi:hypothetical protein
MADKNMTDTLKEVAIQRLDRGLISHAVLVAPNISI